MFSIMLLEDTVKLNANQGAQITSIKENIVKLFEKKILGRINSFIIKIIDLDNYSIKDGYISDIDGSSNYVVKYTAVVFEPMKDQVLDVVVKECTDSAIWFYLKMLPNISMIECICTRKYIPDSYQFDEDLRIFSRSKNGVQETMINEVKESSRSANDIKLGTELKVLILNFQIDSNKIMLFGSLMTSLA